MIENGKVTKIYFLTIIRQVFSIIIVCSLLILRNQADDVVTSLCVLIKILLLLWNCGYANKHVNQHSEEIIVFGRWIISCIVDGCFSIQILISISFHFQDSIENSTRSLDIYLMIYLLFDTMVNLIFILLMATSLISYLTKENVNLTKAIDSSTQQMWINNIRLYSNNTKDDAYNLINFCKWSKPGKYDLSYAKLSSYQSKSVNFYSSV